MTPQQNACLIAIRDLTVDGICPSLEQLRLRLGLASKSGVHRMVLSLEEQGFIRRDEFRQKRIEIIERHGGAISDARIASMSNDALECAGKRIADALAHRRVLSNFLIGTEAQ